MLSFFLEQELGPVLERSVQFPQTGNLEKLSSLKDSTCNRPPSLYKKSGRYAAFVGGTKSEVKKF